MNDFDEVWNNTKKWLEVKDTPPELMERCQFVFAHGFNCGHGVGHRRRVSDHKLDLITIAGSLILNATTDDVRHNDRIRELAAAIRKAVS